MQCIAGANPAADGSQQSIPRRALCSMKDGKHVNLIWLQVVNDSVGSLDHLTDLRDFKFRYRPERGKLAIC
jgi:hypothetical protein